VRDGVDVGVGVALGAAFAVGEAGAAAPVEEPAVGVAFGVAVAVEVAAGVFAPDVELTDRPLVGEGDEKPRVEMTGVALAGCCSTWASAGVREALA